MIQAITNQQVGLNVITELIIGYALPGRPVAMMMFKTWGYITMAQGNDPRSTRSASVDNAFFQHFNSQPTLSSVTT